MTEKTITPRQIYFSKWTKKEQKRLKTEINEEYEQNFKPLVKECLQQKLEEIETKKAKWVYYRKYGDAMKKVITELLEDLEK